MWMRPGFIHGEVSGSSTVEFVLRKGGKAKHSKNIRVAIEQDMGRSLVCGARIVRRLSVDNRRLVQTIRA